MSEGVGGGVVSGRGVSISGEELRETDWGPSSFDPGSVTGDGDGRGLFDVGREWEGLGVR